jgi:hypothetical protein
MCTKIAHLRRARRWWSSCGAKEAVREADPKPSVKIVEVPPAMGKLACASRPADVVPVWLLGAAADAVKGDGLRDTPST